METPNKFNRLASLRRAAGMTQQQLASAAWLNIRRIQEIENGEHSIGSLRTSAAVSIARALGVTVEDLMQHDEDA